MGGEKAADAIFVGITKVMKAEPVRASKKDILIVLGRSLERGPESVCSGRNP